MIDRNSILQIFGSLMKHPQYLSETDKYTLTPDDFYYRFDKYIFIAISNLYMNGAQRIQPIDVENYLSTNEPARIIFKQQNGIEFLQDADELSEELNFQFYYKRLKKFNLLESFKSKGFDTSDIYVDDPLNDKDLKVNESFETLEIDDILAKIKQKLLKIERNFIQNDTTETTDVFQGIEEIIESANDRLDVGIPLQGEIFNEICAGARKGAFYLRSGGSGIGKALPNSTKIPTPAGWRTVGEIKVGDYLFDAFGKPTKVLNVYPQGEKEVWAVHFKDGRIAHCCDEHLWSYCTSNQKPKSKLARKFYTSTLKEINNDKLSGSKGYKYLVPMQSAVEYTEKEFFIPPYVMGLMLGDGSFRQHNDNKSFQFSSESEYLPNIIGQTMGWFVKRNNLANYTWCFAFKEKQTKRKEKINVWVEDVLQDYPDLMNCKSEDKFIPTDYIYSSISQRFDLLNGLLDSDGAVDEKGRVSFFTISPHLRDNVVELCHSLGFKTSISIDSHKSTNVGYQIHITGRPEDKVKLFRLPRKKERIENWYQNTRRKETNSFNPIVKIEDCGYKENMTCFYVDNDEHLFLTEDFIVTHNTRQSVGDACYIAFPFYYVEEQKKWIFRGSNKKVLFIATEQDHKEIQKMILAYLTGFNETKFRYGGFTSEEERILRQAVELIKIFKENFYIVRMPNPTIELLKTIVRENVLMHDIEYVFFDYIHIAPSLLSEFKGFSLRNDKILSHI